MIKSRRSSYSFSAIAGFVIFYFPLGLFVLLVALSFFTYPSAEDLTTNYWDHAFGLWRHISWFYHTSNSRYFAVPTTFFVLNTGFVKAHYYVVALVLWSGLWTVLFLFLRGLGRRISTREPGVRWYVWLAAVLPLAICSILFQPSSAFYWISGSMVYVSGFELFVLLMTILLRAGWRKRATKWETAAAVLLTAATIGCNEIIIYFEVVILVWFQLIYYSVNGKFLRLVNILLMVVLGCVIFLILPAGTSSRAGHFEVHKGVSEALIIAATYTWRDYMRLLVSPMVWLCLLVAGSAGAITRTEVRTRLAGSYWFRPWVCVIPALPGVYFFYFLIYLVSGEVMPPRANRLLQFFIFFFLLVAAFAYGIRHRPDAGLLYKLYDGPVVRLLVMVVFVGSPFFFRTVEDLGLGWVYSRVMEKRQQEIAGARARGKVVLNPYEKDFETVALPVLPKSVKDRLFRKSPKYPFNIFYMDPLADTGQISYYAQYYGIDTINYLGCDHVRVGLTEAGIPPQ